MSRALRAILIAIAALAILTPALLVRYGPTVKPAPRRAAIALPPKRVVPPVEIPPVEPMDLVALAPDDARAFNETVPFVDGPIPPARAFRFAGATEDRARAVDCLAAAVIYEAGDDAVGERAVAQVVLNRVRHPAYPKTVCGVVFQGAERRTGCQFTFTCDGALTRRSPTPAGWARAQAVAAAALNGTVDRAVGWATHYHTDWVVPYWQSSLDKIARVGTHLFFRWSGWWGTPAAFHNPGAQAEPAIAKLAALSDVHRLGTGLSDDDIAEAIGPALALDDTAPPVLAGGDPLGAPGEEGTILIALPRDLAPELFPAFATRNCGDRGYCKFMAWTPLAGVPAALPLTPRQQANMGFSYLRDRARGFDKALWNCGQFKRADPTQCMKVQLLGPATAPLPGQSPVVVPKGPEDLAGVRRRTAPPPVFPTVKPLATPTTAP